MLPLWLWDRTSTSSKDTIIVYFAVVHCSATVVSSADVHASFRCLDLFMIGNRRTLVIVPNFIISLNKIILFLLNYELFLLVFFKRWLVDFKGDFVQWLVGPSVFPKKNSKRFERTVL